MCPAVIGLDSLNQTSGLLLAQEEWQECMGERYEAGIIDLRFGIEFSQVNFLWVREVVAALDAGVEEDAVEVGIGVCDTVYFFQGYKRL